MEAPRAAPREPTPISRKQALSNEMTWKTKLLSQYDITADLTTMADAAERIATATGRRSQIVRELLPAAQQELDGLEAEALLDVVSSLDDKGKPVYSNEAARKAAVDVAMQRDPNAQAAKAQRIELQREADTWEAEADLEHKRYTAARYSVEHKTAAIRVLAI